MDIAAIERRLWEAADQLRANSGLRSSDYSTPVLGLIFLRYASRKFELARTAIEDGRVNRRMRITPEHYQARGVLYLPTEARFDYLMELPESLPLGPAIDTAMEKIEESNPDLKAVLPRGYSRLPDDVLDSLLRLLWPVPAQLEGDGFGLIYEYFLSAFAFSEGQKGGEFFTPASIVKLIVEFLEPAHGKILDPACGSGGMFVHSARFVERLRRDPSSEISIYGQEKTAETVRLAKMNLAVHGLGGDIREGNTYYDDLHNSVGRFDYVMANPPFNANKVDKDRIQGDERFALGLPTGDNANYLWINLFYSALNSHGRAGFVMANSAGDSTGERSIRSKMVQRGDVEIIVSVSSNFFYTVTLPVTLWFLRKGRHGSTRENETLFIDAKGIYRQVDRAHRDWTDEHISLLARIVRVWRGDHKQEEDLLFTSPGEDDLFPANEYRDVPGLCRSASRADIENEGWTLNPGRYVTPAEDSFVDSISLAERLEPLRESYEQLVSTGVRLEESVQGVISALMGSSSRCRD